MAPSHSPHPRPCATFPPLVSDSSRSFGLDLLRAVAIINVLWGHGRSLLPDDLKARLPWLKLDGVTIFFVLSGFLIGRIMMRSLAEGVSVRSLVHFWARRWLRTLPAYYVTLALLVVLAWRFGLTALPATLTDYLWFGQNLASEHPPFFAEAWSLAVEEWFYFLIPLATWGLVALTRLPPRHAVLLVSLITLALVFATRQFMLDTLPYANAGEWGVGMRKQVVTRMDSLVFGVLAAWCWVHAGARTRRWAPGAALVGLVGLAVSLSGFHYDLDAHTLTRVQLLQVPILIALTLPAMAMIRQAPGWLGAPVAMVSRLAYPLYLLHFGVVMHTVLPVLSRRIELGWTTQVVLYWTVSFALAWIMHRAIERPFLRLRDRWLPQGSPSVVEPVSARFFEALRSFGSSRSVGSSGSVSGSSASSRSFGLDLLRTLAILIVVWGHGRLLVPETVRDQVPFVPLDGVTVFFVLSGFLIGRIMMRTLAAGADASALMRFWSRRWLRTLPAYFVTLALLVLFARYRHTELPANLSDFLWFGQNLTTPHPQFFGEAWSLAVEEWFYLLVPLTLWALVGLARMPARHAVLITALITIVVGVVARQYVLDTTVIGSAVELDEQVRKVVVLRLDALMVGVLVAWVWVHHGALSRRWAPIWGAAGLSGLVAAMVLWRTTTDVAMISALNLTAIPLLLALIMPALAMIPCAPAWLARPVAFISAISYSLYLVHHSLVMGVLLPLINEHVWLTPSRAIPLYVILSVGLAWLMYRWIEQPFLRLRDQWMPDSQAASISTRSRGRALGRGLLLPARRQPPER